jgi:predicted acylesterase/phospholipase RssA
VSASPTKRILVHAPDTRQFRALHTALERASARRPGVAELLHWGDFSLSCECHPLTDDLMQALSRQYVNLLVIDLRCGPTPAELATARARGVALLESLDRTEDVEDRYPFHRILVLVGGGARAETDELIRVMGLMGVGGVLRDEGFGQTEADPARFGVSLLEAATRMLSARKTGRTSICAAGGGITGIFFELGALKCLDDCLRPATGDDDWSGGVNAFDMYFGISAGAVVTAPLVMGYSVDEFMAAVAGEPGGRLPRLDLRLFQLGHVDLPGFAKRSRLALSTALGGVRSALRGGRDDMGEQLLFDYADLMAPPFRTDRLEVMLRHVFEQPGGTNQFRRLRRPLYIGATDQDERRHVLFGDEENLDVPISQAVQASLSINPAFSSTRIADRYFEDGAITRTSNFVEAIRRGADLILVLDPFLPYVSRTRGLSHRRGILYNLDQDVRTISYTRYETTRNWVLRKHPEVSSYTFVPPNRLRQLISNNPMDHRPFLDIWRGAYLGTLARLQHLAHRLAGDLAAHGHAFSLERASAVADRLRTSAHPKFSDFFPDGRVALRRPPLAGVVGAPA